MKLISRIEKSYWKVFGICVAFIILRFPSLFEPYWYGDEGIYQVIGKGLANGALLYRDVWDNKPPLLYILYGLVGGDQFGARFLSLLFGLGSVVMLFILARKVLRSPRAAYIATSVFALFFGLPMIEGNIANAENFLILPSLGAGYLFYRLTLEPKTFKRERLVLFFAGVLSGLSLSFKVFGLFDFAAFIGFFIFVHFVSFRMKDMKHLVKMLWPAFAGFILPLVISAFYFLYHNIFFLFLESIFRGNISYVGVENTFIIPQGLLIVKVILLVTFLVVLFLNRKLFSKPEMFIFLWTGFSLFSAFFSQRPYTHYMLVVLPALCLGAGLLTIERQLYRKLSMAGILFLTVVLLSVNFDYWSIQRTVLYYDNFLAFTRGEKDIASYQAFFDRNTPRDYVLAEYIRLHTKPGSVLFIWGNNPQVYYLSNTVPPGRLPTEYHIMNSEANVKETNAAILRRPPKYIIIMPDLQSIPFNMQDYHYQGTIDGAQIYAHII